MSALVNHLAYNATRCGRWLLLRDRGLRFVCRIDDA